MCCLAHPGVCAFSIGPFVSRLFRVAGGGRDQPRGVGEGTPRLAHVAGILQHTIRDA